MPNRPDPSRPNVPPEDKLTPCPRQCGHWVKASKSGDPHTATRTENGEIKTYTCKD